MARSSQKGGYRAYRGRLGKDRSLGHSRHSIVRHKTAFTARSPCVRDGRLRGSRRVSFFRDPGHSHAFDHAFALSEKHGVVALKPGATAHDGEFRVDGEAGLHLLSRLVEPAQMRETGGEIEKGPGIVAVGVDRFPVPGQGLRKVA